MNYILENENDSFRKITINHEGNEKSLSISVGYGDESDLLNYNLCQIDLTKGQLHELIGALIHIQQKMKGGSNG